MKSTALSLPSVHLNRTPTSEVRKQTETLNYFITKSRVSTGQAHPTQAKLTPTSPRLCNRPDDVISQSTAGGIATADDATLLVRLACDGVFVDSGVR